MRVISGRFKGVALTTPKAGTRPTTDRTKEAIFSHLDSWGVLDDARVLDLFAGTGALGIEALSRGARELVAVESSAPAAALIAQTLTVFIDPPYAFETNDCNQLLADLASRELTSINTVIMLERSTRSEEPTAPENWEIIDRRDYGETAVYYIEPSEPISDNGQQ